MKQLLAILLLFFYIYPILFVGVPISTRIIFSFVGVILLMYDVARSANFFFSREYLKIYLILFFIFCLSIASVLFNGTSDLEFVKYPVSFIAILFAASALLRVLRLLNISHDYIFLMKAFIAVVFIQSLISLLIYISSDFYQLFTSMQQISSYEAERMTSFSEFRFIGFGSQYFGAGIIHGLALILLAYLIRIGEFNRNMLRAAVLFIFILAIGIGMARTTFIGLGIAILFLFIPKGKLFFINRRLMKSNAILLLYCVVVIPFVLFLMSSSFPKLISMAKPVIDFAFELFLNYFYSGKFTSASTSHLETMYVFPTNIYTYLIGDGRYYLDDGFYYMNTDVGYLRLIFYFGCGGVILFLTLQCYLLVSAFKNVALGYLFLSFVFIYVLILNLKGFADLSSVLVLFFIANNFKSKAV